MKGIGFIRGILSKNLQKVVWLGRNLCKCKTVLIHQIGDGEEIGITRQNVQNASQEFHFHLVVALVKNSQLLACRSMVGI